jgi:uncharacterized Zn finger protein
VSERRRFWQFEKASKKPPPAHGIKLGKAGTTWWGQRWIEALEAVLGGDASRLTRGRTYARAGRAHDLAVDAGIVTAQVTGTRATPYAIRIELVQLADAAWERAIACMAAQARFSAELLAGRMPTEIDEAFRAGDASLFPRQRTDLVTSCSCPDWGNPCKHVAATHYVLGEALDRDPFLLFELRGRTKQRVLSALRSARGGPEIEAPEPAKASIEGIGAADYDRPRGSLPALCFSFDAPATHGAVLRQLGAPAAWRSAGSPAEALAPIVAAAAEKARRIALSEPRDEPVPATPRPRRAKPPSKRRRARSTS